MAIQLVREKESGGRGELQVPYLIVEDDELLELDRETAIDMAADDAVDYVGSVAMDYKFKRISVRCVRVTILFSTVELSTPTAPPVGELTVDYAFSFQARSRWMMQALDLVGVYDPAHPGGDALVAQNLKYKLGIHCVGGVLRHKGAQIDAADEVFQLTLTAPNVQLSNSYQARVRALCGAFNATDFRGYPPGTIQLVRVQGAKRTNQDWQLSLGFGLVELRENVEVAPGLIVPLVRGCDYLSTVENELFALQWLILKTQFAMVHQVWPLDELNDLELPD